jgi:phage portal protein BeeE
VGLWHDLRTARKRADDLESRYSLDQWVAEYFTFAGNTYGFIPRQTISGNTEPIINNFVGIVQGALKGNGVVFACMVVRQMLFTEARFQFQRMKDGRPGDLFGTPELAILETPWPTGTTGDLLARMEQDSSLAGNAFVRRAGSLLERLRPDWTTIVMGSQKPDAELWDLGTEIIGYIYQPGGPTGGRQPISLTAEEVAHYAPLPDPVSPYRGMSWLQPVINEIQGDTAAIAHKQSFFDNGATINQAIVLDPSVPKEMFEFYRDNFRKEHEGPMNAYKTLFLGGGADMKAIGANFLEMDFKAVQGASETRICAAANLHPTIVGLSEGLQGSSLNAGNFGAARRLTADKCLRPLWRNVSGSLAHIINVPGGSRLWYDPRDIAFLQEDAKDDADIRAVEATSMKTLIDAGFKAETVIEAITSGDMTKLVHTGLFSVQLQAPGSTKMPTGEAPGETPVAGGSAPVDAPAVPPTNGKPPAKTPA